MLSGSYEFLPQDRVIFGRPAAEAVVETADRMAKRRLLIVASKTLSRKTDVVSKIQAALAERCVGVFDECIEHVPRASVLSLAASVRKREPDLIVTVGGGTPIDTVKVTLLTMAAGVTDEPGFDAVRIRVEDVERLMKSVVNDARGLERGSAGKPAWIDHGQRDGVDQHPRIGGARCSEKPVAWTFFDHSALAHDHHPLTDRANNRKVMTDEGERQTHFARQLLEEAQHLRLRRNVEPGDDLVGENEIRPQYHGARDADALTLSAGKLERIPFDRIPLQSDAIKNALHQCERSRVVLRQAMQQDRLGEDAADRVPRIKRGHRVLKDHLHATAQRSARFFVKRGDIAAVEDDRARDRLDQPKQRPAQRGLAGAGLADNTDRLAFADVNVDAVQHGRCHTSAREHRGRPAVRDH